MRYGAWREPQPRTIQTMVQTMQDRGDEACSMFDTMLIVTSQICETDRNDVFKDQTIGSSRACS